MVSSYTNYEWFLEKDLSEYAGKWIAIVDRRVVASGKDVNKIFKEVKTKFPNKRPLITKIRNKLYIL